jgi:Spy/CpxP family protein refolding chaperone
LGLAVALTAFGAGRADDQKKQPDARGRFQQLQKLQQFQVGRAGGPLITAETKDKLNLTADQKEKIAKLEKEFEDKSKETMAKSRETIQKAIQEKDIAALQQMRDVLQANRKLRTEYEGKVSALLTDEQKKKFEEIKKQPARPNFRPNLRRPGADKK